MAICARPYETDADLRRIDTYALESDGESLSMLATCGYERPEPYTSYVCYVQDLEVAPRQPSVQGLGAAVTLYESVGFRRHTRAVQFRKRRS